MRISKSTAFISAAFIAFLFFCIGRYSSADPVAQNITVETERPAAVETGGENSDLLSGAALPSLAPSAPADTSPDTDITPPQTGETVSAPADAPDPETSDTPAVPPAAGLVNINTATAAQLDSLPGIGETLSQRIIEYRESNGPFGSVSDIKLVDGIGEGRFDDIKDLICTH